jgi:hypothetical protein
MSEKSRLALFLVFLGCFVLWLAALLFYIFPNLITAIKSGMIDAAMGVVAGLGIAGITQFFIMALTLAWQFYWRKAKESNTPVNNVIAK